MKFKRYRLANETFMQIVRIPRGKPTTVLIGIERDNTDQRMYLTCDQFYGLLKHIDKLTADVEEAVESLDEYEETMGIKKPR